MEKVKSSNDLPKKSSTANQLKATLICNLISLNTGLATGWVAPAIPQILSDESPIGYVTTDETAWLAAMLPLGAFFNTCLSAYLSEKFGRRYSIIFWAFPFMINSILILIATDINYLLIGRFIAGCGLAGCLSNITAYVGETVVPKIRGAMSSLFSVIYTIGITIAYAVGGFLSYKIIAWIMLFVGIANVILCLVFVPETPFILYKKGQIEKAAASLAWLRRLDVNDPEIQAELTSLKAAIEERPASTLQAAKMILTDKALRRAFLLCMSLFFIQSATGMYAVHSYAISIFMAGGAAELTPPGAAILYGCIQIAGTISSTKFIDKWGRKFLLATSLFGVSLGLLSLATYFYLAELNVDLSYFGWVPILSLCFCVYIYSTGGVGIPLIYVSDVLTNEVRSVATMFMMQTIFFYSFVLLKFFAPLAEIYGFHIVFYFFSVITIFGGLFVSLILPETKGKSIEEILEIMKK